LELQGKGKKRNLKEKYLPIEKRKPTSNSNHPDPIKLIHPSAHTTRWNLEKLAEHFSHRWIRGPQSSHCKLP
jgi:hypothetical protein